MHTIPNWSSTESSADHEGYAVFGGPTTTGERINNLASIYYARRRRRRRKSDGKKTFNFASFGPGVVYSGEGGLYAAVGAKFEVFCELSGRVGLHWKN